MSSELCCFVGTYPIRSTGTAGSPKCKEVLEIGFTRDRFEKTIICLLILLFFVVCY